MADPEGYGFPDDGAGDDDQSIISVCLLLDPPCAARAYYHQSRLQDLRRS